jgi:hypothetical protein
VHPPAPDGSYQVQTTARALEEGSRWVVHLEEEATDGQDKRFRRVAVDGSWTVTTRFPAPSPTEDDVLFVVTAIERGNRSHGCFLLNSPASPVGGLSLCNYHEWVIIMVTRELDDGSTLVRSLIFSDGAPLASDWHLTLRATGAASRQVVEYDDQPGKRGGLRSRVVITGVKDPRLRLVATPDTRAPCRIGLNPANVTTDAPLKLDGLLNSRALRR